MDVIYSEEQKGAIDLCCDLEKRIVCVTGQAGTGKTTVLKEAYKALLDAIDYDEEMIVLAAPTGRAAKRIEEVSGIEAKTIHRLLRYTTPENDEDQTLPKHDKLNPLPHKVILIDEASMIDTVLWRGLIDAMNRGTIIRFFGDINQLPPVANDSKSPFAVALRKFPNSILTTNYRSDDGIISISDKIIKGRIPTTNEQVKVFRVVSTDTMYHIRNLANETDFTKMHSQIIAPTQKTKYGCTAINLFIQQNYNPEKEKLTIYCKNNITGDVEVRSFKRGDKVLWTKNNYDLGIMNGTLGIVQGFDKEEGSIQVTFDGEDFLIPSSILGYNPTTQERYRYDPRQSLMLGYAITTHKSQGSQFRTVLYVLTKSRAATRQNLYTAVTRAQRELVVLNVGGALMHALNAKVEV